MNTQMVPFIAYNEAPRENHNINVRNTILKYLYHWPLFALCFVLSFGGAFLYLKNVSPVYEVTAKLLIKDEGRGGATESAMPELDFIRNNKLIENELEILKSRGLMNKVVNDLQLWITYQEDEKLFDKDLYNTTPVRLVLLKGSKEALKMHTVEIVIVDDKRFILKQPKNEKELNFTTQLKAGTDIFRLDPTENIKEYIGSTIKISVVNPEMATSNYLSKINTSTISKLATVLEINMKETVPERGKDILNRLIAAYNNAALQYKNRITESTLSFINNRLDSITGELNVIEKNVEGFKSSRGLTDISSKSQVFLENVQVNDARLNDVNVQLQVIEGVERYVNSPNSNTTPATTGIVDPSLANLVRQLLDLELQRDKLLGTVPEGNPVFSPINRQIASIKASIKENVQGIKSSLLTTRRQLQTYNNGFEASIRDLPVQERQFISIKRQQSIKEELYVYLLKKQEEAALSYASTLADSRTIDQAFYGFPVSPNPFLILSFAILLALLFPTGLLYARQLLNNRVITSDEIKHTTSIPIIAEFVNQENSSPLMITAGSSGIIAEQFRALRTNLHYLHGHGGKGRVTMLTSGMSGEGKSFVCTNLGLSLASFDRKTVILEMDMRKPGVSKNFSLASERGISDYLKGESSVEEIIQPSNAHPNLWIIRTGPLPANPSDLLGDPKMGELIAWLRGCFDDILIDTPPIHLVTDAMILSSFSDVNLYLIRQAYTLRSELDYVKELQAEGKLQKLNIVFNGVEMGARYSYKMDFDYGYYASLASQSRLTTGSALSYLKKRF